MLNGETIVRSAVRVKRVEGFDYLELANKPTQEELNKYYAEKYFQQALPKNYSNTYSDDELGLITKKLEQRFSAIIESKPSSEFNTFLDVGCGEGFSLKFFLDKGYKVKGLDFSDDGIKRNNPSCMAYFKAGDVFKSLESEIKSGNKYDVIWLQNVLEHVLEPVDLLKKLNLLVSDIGVLVVTVPNDFSSVQKRALEAGYIQNEFWVVSPDHISYFNVSSLQDVVNKTGWKSADTLSDFPIDWFLFNEKSNYVKDSSCGKSAHLARIELEMLVSQNSLEDINNFYRSLAKIGMGRNITTILTK